MKFLGKANSLGDMEILASAGCREVIPVSYTHLTLPTTERV